MRIPFIAGNWKMNMDLAGAIELVRSIRESMRGIPGGCVTVAVCPAFVHLAAVCDFLQKNPGTTIATGAQNMHWEASGAYTGEISGAMIAEIGCRYVIIGHSERRTLFREDDEMVAKKARAAFQYGLLPIVCVGETLEQREANRTTEVVRPQVQKALAALTDAQVEATTIAYEPVWAIGTGRAATPEMAQDVHRMIRETVASGYGPEVAGNVRIQYGGSVNPKNVRDLMNQADIDGALVGGASLKADSFVQLVQAAAGL